MTSGQQKLKRMNYKEIKKMKCLHLNVALFDEVAWFVSWKNVAIDENVS